MRFKYNYTKDVTSNCTYFLRLVKHNRKDKRLLRVAKLNATPNSFTGTHIVIPSLYHTKGFKISGLFDNKL